MTDAEEQGVSRAVDAPVITVVAGDPTAEELAAVIIVLLATGGASARVSPGVSSTGGEWSAYWRGLRTPPPPGPGAWRQSARS